MIEQIADYECITGENPMWHPLEKKVYWLDIPSGRLFRYDPSTQQHENFFTHDEEVGGFTIQPDEYCYFSCREELSVFAR